MNSVGSFVSKVPSVVSMTQLEEDGKRADAKRADACCDVPVARCGNVRMAKLSFAFREGEHFRRVRSFGELSDLDDAEQRSPTLSHAANNGLLGSSDDESQTTSAWRLGSTAWDSSISLLDETLLALWEHASQAGLFRYDVTETETKLIPGVHGFIAQLNEGRATKKRPTEFRVDQVVQPFDDGKFNFTKAYTKEVLFQFDANALGKTDFEDDARTGESPNLVLINVSPIEYGHVLLVPRVLDKLPQLLTPETISLALKFAAAASNPYFRIGYNSLGAYATINHLHFQAYYLMAPYPVERALTVPLKCTANQKFPGIKVSQLVDYPVRGFSFEMTTTLEDMAQFLAHACGIMQTENIPHNLLICDCGARVFLWPQCYARKQAASLVPKDILATGVNPAAFEIAGHMVLKNRDDYDTITKEKVWKMLAEVSLTEHEFDQVAEKCLT